MYGVKLCARCIMTTIDQQTAIKNTRNLLKTLASYRRKGNKILFGQNLAFNSTGVLNIGDEINVLSLHTDERFLIGGTPLLLRQFNFVNL
jgi:uncharacterized protein YcbX